VTLKYYIIIMLHHAQNAAQRSLSRVLEYATFSRRGHHHPPPGEPRLVREHDDGDDDDDSEPGEDGRVSYKFERRLA
jgi:hypothetical protein